MKEKVLFILSLTSFIGIMWISTTTNTTNVKPVISEKLTTPLQKSNSMGFIDEVSPETAFVDHRPQKSDISEVETCSLNPTNTDVFTFGDAFQYYRECLGSDSSFQWKGSTYSTLLVEEVIIQVADSVQVKEKTEKNNQVSEIR